MMAAPIPDPFIERMVALLGGEAADFLASLAESPRAGLRVNPLKISPADFLAIAPFSLVEKGTQGNSRNSGELGGTQEGVQRVPWCSEGFLVDGEERPGRHPYHAAGLYYLQDPSAMAAAVLLDPQPGEWVLDLCAAPGGKATHIAGRLGNEGLLVANEVVRSRAAIVSENLERFGATNTLITSSPAETLAEQWPDLFDRVLVDAPCSAEGMFRKSEAARREWRPSVVAGCAARQETILAAAARMVRPGGRLVYATCTFAPEEDEAIIAQFLHAHPDFHLLPPPTLPGFDPGRPDWIEPSLAAGLPLERCVRLWPHRAPGEGHFLAAMEREEEKSQIPNPKSQMGRQGDSGKAGETRRQGAKSKIQNQSPLRTFWEGAMVRPLPEGEVALFGEWLHWLPAPPSLWQGIKPVRAGWQLGRLAGNRLEPAHHLVMGLRPADVRQTVEVDMGTAERYLRGLTFEAAGGDGWVLVMLDGFPLGWGKRVQGVVKNHYPRGLRWN
jgi:16S rRNA C967 or C1407 C5-methylase (RsmB/RsmF family)/NOL1/NOP2/fmu family ribosome biogenesis protein